MKSLQYVLQRLNKLSDALGDLKERVRDAVAGELSRVIAQTIQDVVHCFVRGQTPPETSRTSPERPRWQDEDPWAEEEEEAYRREPDADEPNPEPEPTLPPANDRWHRALQIGTTVLRWCLAGRWKPLISLGMASLAGVATMWGGPIVQASTGVVLSAAELISLGSPPSLP